ncbi:hypothetical protein [Haloactinopolyspora alba]|uniref:hypothetical protein n=1 Tax=Haloactinopolyspora alba TaxID=648780 RepID=UPI00101D5ED6|nr:hypothetical protein [Haloactinopolyspora alba]
MALTSARGAPGTTTTALVATLTWPRPVLLVEADVSGSSSVKAGHLRGEYDHRRNLITMALAHRNGAMTLESLRHETIPLTEDRSRLVLPGLATRAQTGSLSDGFWSSLSVLFAGLGRQGVDVIVDAGRYGMRHGPDPLLRAADLLAVVSRTGLDDLVSVRANVDQLPGAETDAAAQRRGLVLVGAGRPHRAAEAAAATTLPVWASMAWDPVAADRLNGHDRVRTGLTRLSRSRLLRSGRDAVSELLAACERRRQWLEGPADRAVEVRSG